MEFPRRSKKVDLQSLPSHVIARKVFTFLTLTEAVSVRRTSRLFNTTIQVTVESYMPVFEAKGLKMENVSARALIRRMKALKGLKLVNSVYTVAQDLAVRAGAKLRYLEIINGGVNDIMLNNVARGCLGLEAIKLVSTTPEGLKITDTSLAFLALNTSCAFFLKEIVLQGATGVTERGLSYLLYNCPKLKILQAVNCGVTNRAFAKPLALQENNSDREANIRTLDLSLCHEIGNEGIFSLNNISMLTVLRLSGSTRVTDSSLEYLSFRCPYLTEVSLANCCGITDEGIEALSKGPAGLSIVSLDVARCHRLSDSGLAAICFLGKLKNLDVQGCFRTTDYFLRAASNCRDLEIANFKGMNALTDRGMALFAQGCPAIRSLCLSSCTGLGDETLFFLGRHCRKLMRLDLFCVDRITDDGIYALSIGCTKLTMLNISWCFRLSYEVATSCKAEFWSEMKELIMDNVVSQNHEGRTVSSPSNDKSIPVLNEKYPSAKKTRRRSSSFNKHEASFGNGSKKAPVPGIQLDVAGSPKSNKLLLEFSQNLSVLNLNEVITASDIKEENRPAQKKKPSRRYGDSIRDIEREKAFAGVGEWE